FGPAALRGTAYLVHHLRRSLCSQFCASGAQGKLPLLAALTVFKRNIEVNLKFKNEYGLSDIVAIFAFLMSGLALYQSYKANEGYIVQGGGPVAVGIVDRNTCEMLASIPIIFHNSGKRAVSLRRYVPAGIDEVLFVKDGKIIKDRNPTYDFYISGKQDESMIETLQKAKKFGVYDLDSYSFIDTLIEPGEIHEASIIILIHSMDNKLPLIDRMMVATDVEFGNGQTLEIRSAFNAQVSTPERCRS
ncbi:hypothetical protein KUV22_16290, partial [Microbulbifer agarilyticus]|uniref:hypothetical protein n=1 Tax=Microbulbifer agarilyticus TaxID=260552 RepID=UPI001C97ABCA